MKAAEEPARRSGSIQSVHSLRPAPGQETQTVKLYLTLKQNAAVSAADEGEDEDVKVALGGVISKLCFLLSYRYLQAVTPHLQLTVGLENSFIQ